MTTLILAAGIALLLALAIASWWPAWRLPALAFALLAVPGNVDNLMPQMRLDPNPLPDATAPIVSSLDLLLLWALVLTIRERRVLDRTGRWFVGGGLVLLGLATMVGIVAIVDDVDSAAVVRGVVLFARLPALLYLAFSLRTEIGDGRRVAAAIALGGVVLVGNGVYTTWTADLERFTATTFGRNGLAVGLAIVAISAAGSAYAAWRPGAGRRGWPVTGWALIGAVAVFALLATGTRIALVMLVLAAVGIVVLRPWPASRQQLRGGIVTALVVAVSIGASIALTASGGRSFSVISEAPGTIGETVTGVTDPEELPDYSPIRSRSDFWRLAVDMAQTSPIVGVGPFQWNIERYRLDGDSPKVVADAHNSYLQIVAEFGFPTLLAYGALSAALVASIGLRLLRPRARRELDWTGMALALIALTFPVVELTNSHFFNVRLGPLAWLIGSTAIAITVASPIWQKSRNASASPTAQTANLTPAG